MTREVQRPFPGAEVAQDDGRTGFVLHTAPRDVRQTLTRQAKTAQP
jgi:hypothetical protein